MTRSQQSEHRGGFGSGSQDAEAKRQARLEREQREAVETQRKREESRLAAASGLLAFGALLVLVGLWFLLVSPSEADIGGVAVANLHRLALGETAAIAGSIFVSAGALLRYR